MDFRTEVRAWLAGHLAETPAPDPRAWERELGKAGWIGIGWPDDGETYGNRRATLPEQVVWAEEYARSTAPARMGHIGENLLAPTLITYGTEEQKRRHLPPVARGEALWCQGSSEFNEVFFDGARATETVGGEGNGWQVAMGLLARERGVSTLAQQIGFAEELGRVVAAAVASGAADDPVIRARLVRQWAELDTMRRHALRTLGTTGDPGAPSVAKLLWGGWHQRLGELAVEV
ncbi:acyl-CoA dehydrogenase family protein, partial [Streptomyces sp. MBT61]|uniref:acyl-CoA dehydrogenase family protein n=1 Tax=Streptomyces sp. MBT61 TaxID=1488392 RepID=UPI00190A3718